MEENKTTLSNLNFHILAKNTTFLKRKDIENFNGLKYAVAVFNAKHDGIDKEICEIYIKTNDDFYPPINPTKRMVKN